MSIDSHELVEISEGKAKILVPKSERKSKGPGKIDAPVFYNPAMAHNRDISMLVLQAFVSVRGRRVDVLDGMAASGVRGVRFCKEIEGDFSVTINDWSEESHSLIQKNIERNGCANAAAANRDLNKILCEKSFDYIDIDPFGTAVPFIDNAVRVVRHKGILAITTTDTATLCGSGALPCIRRYGAKPMQCDFMHEVGLRIFAGYVVRMAAKYDRAARPLLCYADGHYMRCYFEILDGAKRADALLSEMGYVHLNMETMARKISAVPLCRKPWKAAGPLWTGKTIDAGFVNGLKLPTGIDGKSHAVKIIPVFREEADAPALYYNTAEFSSAFHVDPPALQDIIEAIRSKGFFASRTHFSPMGVKTDAPLERICKILRQKPKESEA
jgi:tRNA (guanine26-N2/guanine27-N2)-dimethyltransferase